MFCVCCNPVRWFCRYVGRSRLWQWQLCSRRSTQECQADWGQWRCICGDPGRWISGDLGLVGPEDCGANSSAIQHQLRSVQQIRATSFAFAAILADWSVVTWGDPDESGDSSKVQHKLRRVQHVQSTSGAFATILDNGSVVMWGNPDEGGDSSGAGPGHMFCVCCNPVRWFCRYVGRSRLWQWQLCSRRSTQECQADWGHWRCICGDPGRWISRDLGPN